MRAPSLASMLAGGSGDDSYTVYWSGNTVVENPGEGNDSVLVLYLGNYVAPENIENISLWSAISQAGGNLAGNALDNMITGSVGSNRIDGGPGADTLAGGGGADTYVLDSTRDVVNETFDTAIDTVEASVSRTLESTIENLVLAGSAAIDATGNELSNRVTGNSAANRLYGGGGSDRLVGNGGNDTLDGGPAFDWMTGGSGDDIYTVDTRLPGFALAFTGEPDEYVSAGLTHYYTATDGTFDALTLYDMNSDGQIDQLTIRFFSPGLEHFWHLRFAADKAGRNLAPGDYADTRTSAFVPGHPMLDLSGDGRGGQDYVGNFSIRELEVDYSTQPYTLVRFSASFEERFSNGALAFRGVVSFNGNGSLADQIIEDANDGNDTAQSSLSYLLPVNIEILALTGANSIHGTGNAAANALTGNAASNRLDGLEGDDTLTGGAGNDTLDGGPGADSMRGGAGNDLYIVNDSGDSVIEIDGPVPSNFAVNAAGVSADANTFNIAVSPDGRHVAFASYASNLVPGDNIGSPDIFIKDLVTGVIERVTSGAAASPNNYSPAHRSAYSADGHFLAFESYASDLVAGDSNGQADIFVKNLQTGTIVLASRSASAAANGSSALASMSGDGRYVAFSSVASNLVDGDDNGNTDVFVKDLLTGEVQRVSTAANGAQADSESSTASFAADGLNVVFLSYASNLVAGDTNGTIDVFIKNLQTGAIQRVSTDASGAQTADGGFSTNGRATVDGRFVVFTGTDLVAGDTNGKGDVYIKDIQTGALRLVSTDVSGQRVDDGSYGSSDGSLSADGRFVVFTSDAGNLVPGDSNGIADIFVKDLQSGNLARVSTAAYGAQAPGYHRNPAFSADGRELFFDTDGDALVPGGSGPATWIARVNNPFLESDGGIDTVEASVSFTLSRNIENLILTGGGTIDGTGNPQANTITGNSEANRLQGLGGDDSLTGGGGADTLEGGSGDDNLAGGIGSDNLRGGDGRDTLDGEAGADTLEGGAGADLYIVDDYGDSVSELDVNGLQLISITADQAAGHVPYDWFMSSGNGRYIIFASAANNLVAGDTNNKNDVFVRDLVDGTTRLVSTSSTGALGNRDSYSGSLSADGRFAVFSSSATNLVAGDFNPLGNVYVKGLLTGITIRVSLNAAGEGNQPGGRSSTGGSVSADGRYVAFSSDSSDLVAGDTNFRSDVFVKDLATGAVVRASTSASGVQSTSFNDTAVLSPDGRYVAFANYGIDLVPGDSNPDAEVLLKDLLTGALVRVNTNASGAQVNGYSSNYHGGFSADSRFYVFGSNTSDLGLSDGSYNIYVKNLATGAVQAIRGGSEGSLSGDGRYLAFSSLAADLVADDFNGVSDVFVKDMASGEIRLVSRTAAGLQGNGNSFRPTISTDGRQVLFSSQAGNLVDGDSNGAPDLFRVDNPFLVSGGGTGDRVQASVSYTLPANVETLTLTGSDSINGSGNALDNFMIGNGFANLLTGGAGNDSFGFSNGNDTLDGGSGIDTAYFAGNRAAYTITRDSAHGAVFVAALSGTEGTKLW